MLLQVDGVVAGYGQVEVLHGLSIAVGDGERVGLFGPNGHGKTTLLRAISGLLPIQRGSVEFQGAHIAGLSPRGIVGRGLIHVPQGNTLFPRMTVLENLTLGAYVGRAWDRRRESLARVFELFPRLAERRNQYSRTLSGGERQMLSIGVGLMGIPTLLMLDEPSLGLAPKIKDELTAAIGQIATTGVTMLVVDQDLELLLSVCRRMYLIEKGQVSLQTREGATIQQSEILEMYFGKVAPGAPPRSAHDG
jgi:branched-chain amino acid transport system ATP-binding protein